MESKRERSRRKTRQKIFEAARSLYLEDGAENVTTRQIADRAGVGLGTVNLHFKDKTSLLLEVFYEKIEAFSFGLLERVPDGTLTDQLRFLVESEYSFYVEHPSLSRVVKESMFVDGAMGEQYDAQMWRYCDRLSGLFGAARQRGEIRRDADCAVAAHAVASHYLFGLIIGARETPFNRDKALAMAWPLIELLIQGLLSQEEHHES